MSMGKFLCLGGKPFRRFCLCVSILNVLNSGITRARVSTHTYRKSLRGLCRGSNSVSCSINVVSAAKVNFSYKFK